MKYWKDIDEDEILNFEGTHTGHVAQYERIMSRRLRDSIDSLSSSFVRQSQELTSVIADFNKTSTKLSRIIFWLNVILVFLTLILVGQGFRLLYPMQ